MRVDSHHHFWNYSAEQYGWISEKMQVLRRDFAPKDLLAQTESTHIDSVESSAGFLWPNRPSPKSSIPSKGRCF